MEQNQEFLNTSITIAGAIFSAAFDFMVAVIYVASAAPGCAH
jgi:hypothetical protein